MNPSNNNPFHLLHENASNLFQEILTKNQDQMKCNKGCSQCCEAEFSIFTGEAEVIWQWFQTLSVDKKNSLTKSWATPKTSPSVQCAFLSEGACTIYEARPTICRTQGAPLQIENNLDCCPLNFEAGARLPSNPKEWIQLEKLTEIQSWAEQWLNQKDLISAEIKALAKSNGRIELKKLNSFLKLKLQNN